MLDTVHVILLVAAQSVALSMIMTGAWFVQQRTGNSGWIDAIWTFGLGSVGIVSALIPLPAGTPLSWRQIAVAALAALWAIRLGSHIVRRSATRPDDPRYGDLVRQWGANARTEMFWLMQKQALVSIPLAITLALAAHNPAPEVRALDVIAIVLIFVSIAGEGLADRQLRDFAREARNKGRVCDKGLWRYSRHPNYFFEWLYWLAYALLAIDLTGAYPWGWIAIAGPVCMYWLLRYVSGVPPLEDHMLRRYGAPYRDYQERTSAFFPWAPAAN